MCNPRLLSSCQRQHLLGVVHTQDINSVLACFHRVITSTEKTLSAGVTHEFRRLFSAMTYE